MAARGTTRPSRNFRCIVLMLLAVLAGTVLVTTLSMSALLPPSHESGLGFGRAAPIKPVVPDETSRPSSPTPRNEGAVKRPAATQLPAADVTPEPSGEVDSSPRQSDAPPHQSSQQQHHLPTEVFFDETCQQLQPSAALSSPHLRFAVQRFFGSTIAVEAITEFNISNHDGSRKRTVERSQYIPDDVIVVSPKQGDPILSYTETGDVMFAQDDHAALTCASGSRVHLRYGPQDNFRTATVEYRLLGNIEDPNKPDLDASVRDKLGHIGREHKFGAGGSKISVTFTDAVDFVGLGNRGAGIKIDDNTEIKAKNLDINHYQLDSHTTLYGVVPLVYVISRQTSVTCGFLLLNGSPLRVTTRAEFERYSISFETSDGGVRYFFFPGPTPADVLRQYFAITGRPFMPPLFSLGFHQSRWSYRDEADLLAVSRRFKEAEIPCDVLWLDIDHTDDKRYFTWDKRLFPDPKAMLGVLQTQGRRLVTITDPHIKRDPGYFVFSEAHAHGYFVADESGSEEFRGHCWPGESSWIDFVNPEARKWYSSLFGYDRYESTPRLFSWIDMNEPSVFSGPEMTMPMGVRHVNNIPHMQVHNLYGFYHSMAASQGHLHRSDQRSRSFVLTRSFFAGSHRYAAVWTGDNQARWDHLRASIDMVLLLSLSGIVFSGADVGGFFGNPEPELLVRWFQLGCIYPFFRQHSDDHSDRREPFVLPEPQRTFVSEAIAFRYLLLPYLYTTFAQVSGVVGSHGTTVMRHLMLMFPEDPHAYGITHTFMVGDSLLARPVVATTNQALFREGRSNFDIFVPGRSPKTFALDRRAEARGTPLMWFSLCTGFSFGRGTEHSTENGIAPASSGITNVMEEYHCPVPIFQRAGSIIPVRPTVGDSSDDASTHPIELRVALDAGDYAEGILYLDDGHSKLYATGAKCVMRFIFERTDLCAYAGECLGFDPEDVVGSVRLVNESSLEWTHATVRGQKAAGAASGPGELGDDDLGGSTAEIALARRAAAAYHVVSDLRLPLGRAAGANRNKDKLPSGASWCVRFFRKKKPAAGKRSI